MKKITLLLFALVSGVMTAQDGLLDTSYGTNGYALVPRDNGATIADFVLPDGKIIYVQGTKIKRLNADGTPDASFGQSGSINIAQSFYYIESILVANNQVILLTKEVYDIYKLGRYNFDGTVDATLGSGLGYVTLNLGDDIDGHVRAKMSSDGKLLIGGNSDTAYGTYNDYYVRKYNLDGTLDSSFNFDASELGLNIGHTSIGYATDEFFSDLDITSNGSVIVSGMSSYHESSSTVTSYTKATFAIISATDPNGQPAVTQNNYTAYNYGKGDLTLDQDDNIYVLGGQTTGSSSAPVNLVQKWTASGSVAVSFGDSGVVTLAPLNIDANTKADFRKILIQPDGKILVAGLGNTFTFTNPYLIVARYLTDGTLDATFGTNGYMLADIPHPNTPANFNSITQFYASADFSSIYLTGYNQQNAAVIKFGNPSMLPLIAPTFNAIAPICAGDSAPALPTTSNNNITGTWSPAVIDNTASGTYTFTPDAGQNAETAILSVTVNQPTVSSVTETACSSFTWEANGETYIESGTYTHVTTNEDGCSHTATLKLTINQPTSSVVNETACDSFTWSANGITYTDSGSYSVITTNENGCTHTTTLELTINESATIIAEPVQELEEGLTLADLAVSPSDVVWYGSLDDAAAQQNPIPASTVVVNGTTYYAVNFSGQGCPSAPFAVTVTTFLSNDSFDVAHFGLYPNPTSDFITITYANEIDNVTVFNVLGQQVLAKNINANQGNIDLSALTAGTYFIKVTAGSASKTLKVLKK